MKKIVKLMMIFFIFIFASVNALAVNSKAIKQVALMVNVYGFFDNFSNFVGKVIKNFRELIQISVKIDNKDLTKKDIDDANLVLNMISAYVSKINIGKAISINLQGDTFLFVPKNGRNLDSFARALYEANSEFFSKELLAALERLGQKDIGKISVEMKTNNGLVDYYLINDYKGKKDKKKFFTIGEVNGYFFMTLLDNVSGKLGELKKIAESLGKINDEVAKIEKSEGKKDLFLAWISTKDLTKMLGYLNLSLGHFKLEGSGEYFKEKEEKVESVENGVYQYIYNKPSLVISFALPQKIVDKLFENMRTLPDPRVAILLGMIRQYFDWQGAFVVGGLPVGVNYKEAKNSLGKVVPITELVLKVKNGKAVKSMLQSLEKNLEQKGLKFEDVTFGGIKCRKESRLSAVMGQTGLRLLWAVDNDYVIIASAPDAVINRGYEAVKDKLFYFEMNFKNIDENLLKDALNENAEKVAQRGDMISKEKMEKVNDIIFRLIRNLQIKLSLINGKKELKFDFLFNLGK